MNKKTKRIDATYPLEQTSADDNGVHANEFHFTQRSVDQIPPSESVATPQRESIFGKYRQLLENSEELEEITSVLHTADAARLYAAKAKLGLDVQNHAAELKMRAERKAGTILASLRLRGGDRRSTDSRGRLKLSDFGISQNESKRWQKIAAIPSEAFEEYLAECDAQQRLISAAGLFHTVQTPPAPNANQEVTRLEFTLPESPNCIDTLIQELIGHCNSLQSVLDDQRSSMNGADAQGNRPSATRYLKEMKSLLSDLTRLVDCHE